MRTDIFLSIHVELQKFSHNFCFTKRKKFILFFLLFTTASRKNGGWGARYLSLYASRNPVIENAQDFLFGSLARVFFFSKKKNVPFARKIFNFLSYIFLTKRFSFEQGERGEGGVLIMKSVTRTVRSQEDRGLCEKNVFHCFANPSVHSHEVFIVQCLFRVLCGERTEKKVPFKPKKKNFNWL